MDKAQIEKALRHSSNSGLLRKTILNILSKELFFKKELRFFLLSCFQATISNWTSLKTQNETGLQLPPFSQKAIYPFDVTTHPMWMLGGTTWCEFKGDSTQSSIHFIISLTPHWLLKHRTRTERTTQCFCSSNVIPRPPGFEERWDTSTQLQGPQRQWQLGGVVLPCAERCAECCANRPPEMAHWVLTTYQGYSYYPHHAQEETEALRWFPQGYMSTKGAGAGTGIHVWPWACALKLLCTLAHMCEEKSRTRGIRFSLRGTQGRNDAQHMWTPGKGTSISLTPAIPL